MHYIADIIIAAVFIIFTISGIRKGIFLSLVDLLGGIISAIMAVMFSNGISTFLFNTFIKSGLHDRILSSIESSSANLAISNIMESFPQSIVSLLEKAGVTQTTLAESAGQLSDSSAIADVVVGAISPSIIMIINFFVIIILFIVFMIIIKAVGKSLDKILDLPILAQLNDALGGIFGFAFALTLVYICLSAINFIGNLTTPEVMVTVNEALEKSILTGLIMNYNPFSTIFG